MARRAAGVALLVTVGGFIALAAACSNQGEGERCQSANGNDDCNTAEGLICIPEGQLRNANSDHCCPADRSKAKHPICQRPVDIVGDGGAPPDTGPPPTPDAGGTDAQDAGTEDASSDAADADAQ